MALTINNQRITGLAIEVGFVLATTTDAKGRQTHHKYEGDAARTFMVAHGAVRENQELDVDLTENLLPVGSLQVEQQARVEGEPSQLDLFK